MTETTTTANTLPAALDAAWGTAGMLFAFGAYALGYILRARRVVKRGGHEVTNGYGFPTCIEKTP